MNLKMLQSSKSNECEDVKVLLKELKLRIPEEIAVGVNTNIKDNNDRLTFYGLLKNLNTAMPLTEYLNPLHTVMLDSFILGITEDTYICPYTNAFIDALVFNILETSSVLISKLLCDTSHNDYKGVLEDDALVLFRKYSGSCWKNVDVFVSSMGGLETLIGLDNGIKGVAILTEFFLSEFNKIIDILKSWKTCVTRWGVETKEKNVEIDTVITLIEELKKGEASFTNVLSMKLI